MRMRYGGDEAAEDPGARQPFRRETEDIGVVAGKDSVIARKSAGRLLSIRRQRGAIDPAAPAGRTARSR